MRRALWVWAAAALVLSLLPAALRAQPRSVSRAGEGQAAVYQDDLEQARRRAVAQAQRAAVRGLLTTLLAPEWFALFEEDLESRVLKRLDAFVGSFSISRLETSLDRTQYFATVEAQMDRSRVVAELRALSLPILGEPPVPLHVLYAGDDPVLRDARVREPVLAALGERLGLLNLTPARVTPIPAAARELFGGTPARQSARASWLAELKSPAAAVAFLSFAPPTTIPPADTDDGRLEASLQLFLVRDGSVLAEFAHTSAGAMAPGSDRLLERLVRPLLARMQPGALGNPPGWGKQLSRLALRVLGLESVYAEERFERALFSERGLFEGFVLSRIETDAVTYEGEFSGDREQLPEDLRGQAIGGRRIRDAFWHGNVLELMTMPLPPPARMELKPFPPAVRPRAVQALFEESEPLLPSTVLEQAVISEVEDNGQLDRGNPIVFDTAIYGFVDSRVDSDVYVGEILEPGERIEIEWYRLGRTNLDPVLRFYDEQGVLRGTTYLRQSGQARYRIPKGQHGFYVEAADRYGHLDWDTGGYLNYHYLMWIRRPDAPRTARRDR